MSYLEDERVDQVAMVDCFNAQQLLLKKGKCPDCGSENIKTSKKGYLYCAELCWVKSAQPTAIKKMRGSDV